MVARNAWQRLQSFEPRFHYRFGDKPTDVLQVGGGGTRAQWQRAPYRPFGHQCLECAGIWAQALGPIPSWNPPQVNYTPGCLSHMIASKTGYNKHQSAEL